MNYKKILKFALVLILIIGLYLTASLYKIIKNQNGDNVASSVPGAGTPENTLYPGTTGYMNIEENNLSVEESVYKKRVREKRPSRVTVINMDGGEDHSDLKLWIKNKFNVEVEIYTPSEGVAGINFRDVTMDDKDIYEQAEKILSYIFEDYNKNSGKIIGSIKLNYFYSKDRQLIYEYIVFKTDDHMFSKLKEGESIIDRCVVIKE